MVDFSIEGIRSFIDENFDRAQLQRTAAQYLRNHPSFFAPYKSGLDFIETLKYPIVIPLAGSLLTGLLGAASAISAAVCVCSLAAAAIAAASGKTDTRNTALSAAALTGLLTFVAPLLTALAAVLTVLLTAAALVQCVTRTGATIVSPIVKAIQSGCSRNTNVAPEEVEGQEEQAPSMTM